MDRSEYETWGLTQEHFRICNELATEAGAQGNPPVGCLIVMEGQILARAMEATRTKQDVTAHAEMEALRLARWSLRKTDLSECLLLTTHEPCVMCSYAIRFHRISRVVYRQPVPHLGGATSSFPVLTTTETPPAWGPPPQVITVDF